jgi:hypothetical protein
MENDIGGLLFTIIELRAYARAKETYESTPMDKRPKNKMIDMVGSIKVAIQKKKIAEFEQGQLDLEQKSDQK